MKWPGLVSCGREPRVLRAGRPDDSCCLDRAGQKHMSVFAKRHQQAPLFFNVAISNDIFPMHEASIQGRPLFTQFHILVKAAESSTANTIAAKRMASSI